jgi:hypothetical protein
MIVAWGRLVNQTASIPTTTIFTPTQDGLYRMSVYITMTKADPNSGSYWTYNIAWTDDAGAESENELFHQNDNTPGQFVYQFLATLGGTAVPFEAKAGTPVTHSTKQVGPPDSSAYSLYYVIERLN